MVKLSFLVVFCFCLIKLQAQDDVYKASPYKFYLDMVVPITTEKGNATAFFFYQDSALYLVTARHVFPENAKSGDSIQFAIDMGGVHIDQKHQVFFHPNDSIDIALTWFLRGTNLFLFQRASPQPVFYGQDVTFFGYPLGLKNEYQIWKFPLIKKAMISGFQKEGTVETLLLDGHNNQGFSGGPVVAGQNGKQNVIGVISGYRNELSERELFVSNGSRYIKNKVFLAENSGLIITYPIRYVQDIITFVKANMAESKANK